MTTTRMTEPTIAAFCQGCHYGIIPQETGSFTLREDTKGQVVLWHWPCLVRALDRALEPFAKLGDLYNPSRRDDEAVYRVGAKGTVAVTVGDLRAARAALGGKKP